MASLYVREPTDLLTVIFRFEGREVARVSGKDCTWRNGAIVLPPCPEELDVDEVLLAALGAVVARRVIRVGSTRVVFPGKAYFVDAAGEEAGDESR